MEKIQWQTPEYIYKEKTTDWYWIVGIISVSIAIIAIILNNAIFGILILVSAFSLSLFATRPPKIIQIEIDNFGIKIGETVHPFVDLESFWVETRDVYPRVFFKSKKKIALYTIVLLSDADPNNVRQFLANHLTEIEHSEPFLEKVLFWLGF